MRMLTHKEYKRRMTRIKMQNISKRRKQKLREERNKYKKKHKTPSTSKMIAIYLFVILNVVLVYAMISMWKFMDLSYLGVLITDVAAQVLTYIVYSAKSLKENTVSSGFVYEARMKELDTKNPMPVYNDEIESLVTGDMDDDDDEFDDEPVG